MQSLVELNVIETHSTVVKIGNGVYMNCGRIINPRAFASFEGTASVNDGFSSSTYC